MTEGWRFTFAGNHDVWSRDHPAQEVGAIIHHDALTVELLGKTFCPAPWHMSISRSSPTSSSTSSSQSPSFAYSTERSTHAGLWALPSAAPYVAVVEWMARRTHGRIPHAYHNDYFGAEQELSYALPSITLSDTQRSITTSSGTDIHL